MMKEQKIKELAQVYSGTRYHRYQTKTGEYEYKIISYNKNDDYEINLNNTETITTEKPLNKNLLLKKGDIIMKLTPNYLAKVIDSNQKNLIAPNNYAIIKTNDKINPYLLEFYLNSEPIKRQIQRVGEESLIKIIKINDIKEFNIIRKDPKLEELEANMIISFKKRKELIEKQIELEELILNDKILNQ